MPAVVALACQRHPGFVYVFDGSSGAYDRLPGPLPPPSPYWQTEQSLVGQCGVPPETTITSGPSGTVTVTDATFTFVSSKANSTFECRLDGAPWGACTSPKSYTGLAPGSHTFEVRAIDPAGNVDPSPAIRVWTIQLVSPCEQLGNLVVYISGLGLSQGLERSLSAKVENAQRDCEAGHENAACHKLDAFKNEVRAQEGQGLTGQQAADLLARAEAAQVAMNCG